MKKRITRNDLRGENVKYCGYMGLQYLLHFKTPSGYNAGIYGWNYDVYFLPGLIIVTGYRGMPGKRLKKVNEYEQKARAVVESDLPYAERKEKVNSFLNEFININKGK